MIPFAVLQLLYIAACLVAMGAIFVLQWYRLRRASACRWWLYAVLTFGLFYEAIEAWKYGAPALPAGRWIVVPSLAAQGIVVRTAPVAEWLYYVDYCLGRG